MFDDKLYKMTIDMNYVDACFKISTVKEVLLIIH